MRFTQRIKRIFEAISSEKTSIRKENAVFYQQI